MDMGVMGGLEVHGEFGAVGSRFEVVGDHGRYREVDLERTTLRDVSGHQITA